MSAKAEKIDLSKCKVGDKAVTRDGYTLTFKGRRDRLAKPYIFGCSCGRDHSFSQDGRFGPSKENCRDIVGLILSDEPAPKPKAAKKPAVPELPPGSVRVADCVGTFLVVEGDKNGGVIDLESLTAVRGPFKSIQAAEKDIRDDAIATYSGDRGNSLSDLENWGSDCLIVEVKRAVRPVPTVKVGCEIETIAGGVK